MRISDWSSDVCSSDLANDPSSQIPTVTVMQPGSNTIVRDISATGTIAARREMPVGVAGEGGRVTRVLVDAGTWVKAGQVLATVDRSVQSETDRKSTRLNSSH